MRCLLILVTPHFNLHATTAFIDPFRASNYLDGRTDFEWRVVSSEGGPCPASNGVTIETDSLKDVEGYAAELVIISSSWAPETHDRRLAAKLRSAAKSGATLGALDTGAFILADAGLLRARRATVHYEHIDAFRELYPETDCTEDLFVAEGDRITCGGGSASAEAALFLLEQAKGAAAANAAARYILHGELRPRGAQQNPQAREPLGSTVPETVREAIRMMEAHLEAPLPIPQIAAGVGRSHRQLDRLFADYVGKPPAAYYRDIRLDRARGLVTQTELPVAEIAYACGFPSQVHFSRAYRARFGLPPRSDRIEGRIPFEFRPWPMHRRRSESGEKS